MPMRTAQRTATGGRLPDTSVPRFGVMVRPLHFFGRIPQLRSACDGESGSVAPGLVDEVDRLGVRHTLPHAAHHIYIAPRPSRVRVAVPAFVFSDDPRLPFFSWLPRRSIWLIRKQHTNGDVAYTDDDGSVAGTDCQRRRSDFIGPPDDSSLHARIFMFGCRGDGKPLRWPHWR